VYGRREATRYTGGKGQTRKRLGILNERTGTPERTMEEHKTRERDRNKIDIDGVVRAFGLAWYIRQVS